jgi:hypothetical protein
MTEQQKKINITGTNNRYQIKKMVKDHKVEKEIKKRVVSENWCFTDEQYSYHYQLKVINSIFENNFKYFDEISKIAVQEINRKISSYKQQDALKKHYEADNFLTFECVIHKLIESEMKCRYCKCEMSILYDVSREMKQWSVDRIDNDKGHNTDNFHLACLDCNLKRRRRTDEKFLFTKQLNIVKQDNTKQDN